MDWSNSLTKRGVDLLLVALSLPCVLPVLGLIALAVRCFLGSPVLFRQERAGRHGRPFVLFKFRTMSDRRGKDGELLPDEERLGRFGRFLRSTSLDELPELWNVVRGEMRLVGPRPLLMEYLPRYTPEQNRRHDVPPGLTGWQQVRGRNRVDWPERFAQDVWYVDHASLALDVQILVRTVWKVIARSDISPADRATPERFTGSPESDRRAA